MCVLGGCDAGCTGLSGDVFCMRSRCSEDPAEEGSELSALCSVILR